MENKNIFWFFAPIQAMTLGLIVFFILGLTDIEVGTKITLSILFPLFTLIVEYMIYSK